METQTQSRGICSHCKQPVDVDPGGFAEGHDRWCARLGVRSTCWGTQELATDVTTFTPAYDPVNGLSSDFSACRGVSTPMIMDGPASWHDCFGDILTSDFPDFANIPARVATIARAESVRGVQS